MLTRLDKRFATACFCIAALAVGMRTVPVVVDGAWRYRVHNDDAVYYAAAASLLHGELPYTDLVFVHPPAILLVLVPAGVLGSWWGDSVGLIVARETFVMLGALNAVLVTAVLWRRGVTGAVFGGLLYAVWGVAALPETTIQLVTLLSTCLLVAVLLLDRARPRPGWAGVALGLACATKIWAFAPLGIVLVVVWARHGTRPASRLLAAATATLAVTCAPFVLADPTRAWRLVVSAQLGRERLGVEPADRWWTLVAGVSPRHGPVLGIVLVGLAVAAALVPLAVALARRVHPRAWSDATWTGLLLGVQVLMIAVLAPSYYPHYAAFVAPTACVAAGGLVGLLGPRPAARLLPALLVVPALATIGATTFTPIDHDALRRAADGHTCVWALRTSLLVGADLLSRDLDHRCDVDVDAFGTRLSMTEREYHERVRLQLASATLVLDDGFLRDEIGRENRLVLERDFTDVGRIGDVVVRERR